MTLKVSEGKIPIHLLAIDPAKSKPSWGASFLNGRFQGFASFSYKKILKHDENNIPFFLFCKNIAVIEKPYINMAHSIKNQLSLAIAIGEIGQVLRTYNHMDPQYIDSYGNKGWIQSYFGQKTKRADALALAMQIAKADGVEVKNNDQAMAYCLGLWWLRNNREE